MATDSCCFTSRGKLARSFLIYSLKYLCSIDHKKVFSLVRKLETQTSAKCAIDSTSVGPDTAKCRHFGHFKIFGNFLWGPIYYLSNFWTYFSKFFMPLGKFSFLKMAKYLTNNLAIWSHCSSSFGTACLQEGRIIVFLIGHSILEYLHLPRSIFNSSWLIRKDCTGLHDLCGTKRQKCRIISNQLQYRGVHLFHIKCWYKKRFWLYRLIRIIICNFWE